MAGAANERDGCSEREVGRAGGQGARALAGARTAAVKPGDSHDQCSMIAITGSAKPPKVSTLV